MCLFSIIVPIYQVENYLYQCLTSVRNQSFQDYEVIMVNDGSKDNCPDICEYFAKEDKRFRVIHKKNEGLVKARKTGVELARGKYITFVDGDDWIESNTLQEIEKILESYEVDMISFGFIQEFPKKKIMYEDILREGYYSKDQLIKEVYSCMLCTENFFEFGIRPSVWSKFFKRELIEKVIFTIDEKITMGEDVACTYPCLYRAQNFFVLKKHFYHYRYVETSMSQKYDKHYFEKISFLYSFLEEQKYLNERKQLLRYQTYLFLLGVSNEFLYAKSINKACKRIKDICTFPQFSNLILSYEECKIVGKEKRILDKMKQNNYGWLLWHFSREKMYIKVKQSIKKRGK